MTRDLKRIGVIKITPKRGLGRPPLKTSFTRRKRCSGRRLKQRFRVSSSSIRLQTTGEQICDELCACCPQCGGGVPADTCCTDLPTGGTFSFDGLSGVCTTPCSGQNLDEDARDSTSVSWSWDGVGGTCDANYSISSIDIDCSDPGTSTSDWTASVVIIGPTCGIGKFNTPVTSVSCGTNSATISGTADVQTDCDPGNCDDGDAPTYTFTFSPP